MRLLIFLFWTFVTFVVATFIIGGIARLFGGRRIQPSHLSWAVGWISGFFLVGAVVFFPNLVVVFSHWPPANGWNWLEGFAGILLVLRGRAYLKKSFSQKIPVDPPYCGLVTVWDHRTSVIKDAGRKFLAPYWPFNVRVILVKIARYNLDRDFTEFSTNKAGVTVNGKWSIVYSPNVTDGQAAQAFLQNEKQKGIDDQLTDIVPKALKNVFGGVSWEDATRGHDETVTLQEIFGVLTRHTAPSQRELNQGVPDVLGLGIRVHSFYLKEVRVNDATAQQAREKEAQKIKREGQLEEIKGVAEQIELLTSKTKISPDKALDMVSIRAGEVEKIIVEIQGLEGGGGGRLNSLSISALLTQLLIEAGVPAKKAIEIVTSRANEIEKFVAEVQSGGSQGGSGLSMVGLAGLLNVLGVSPQNIGGKKRGGQGTQPEKGGKEGKGADLRARARRV